MSAASRLREIAGTRRDLLMITLAALIVRLVWNLVIHPPLDYAFSDMGGYLERAQTSIDHFGERFGHFTLFPWGTHFLLMLVKRAFGRDNATAIGVTYALLGAGAVLYASLLARQLTRSVWITRVVGAILIVYYPWISLGGYVLSEPPFTLFLCAGAYHGLVFADRGRPRDAWLFGASLALAAVFRPQILAAVPLYAALWLWRRRASRRLTLRLLLAAAVPLVVVLGVSSARMRFHTGRFGLISNNGPLNFAFGRCHATTITSIAPDRKGVYSPPSLGALGRWEREHPDALFKLHTVGDPKRLFDGHMWDAAPLYWMAAECVRNGGIARQIEFAVTHVVLLWGYNVVWPDSTQTPAFRRPMEISGALNVALILPGALWSIIVALRKRHARLMLVALHPLCLMLVAVIYFGDTRLRAPYDGTLVVLAITAFAALARAVARRRARAS